MMSVARRLATAAPARRVQGTYGPGLDIHPSSRPRAGHTTSRQFCSGPSSEKSEKYQRLLLNVSAGLGCVSTLAGMIGGAGYYVINTINYGIDEKFRKEKEATDAKLDAEKVRREGFQTLATKTHLDTVRKMDETVADLRSQFNNLSIRCLEWQSLEGFYRSQLMKAQEVLDREGVTSSAEVHKQLLPKIGQLQAQLDLITEEVSKLRLIAQASAAAAAAAGHAEKMASPTEVLEAESDTKGSSAAAMGQNGKSDAPTAQMDTESSDGKVSSAAAMGQNQKRDNPTAQADGKNPKSQPGGAPGSV